MVSSYRIRVNKQKYTFLRQACFSRLINGCLPIGIDGPNYSLKDVEFFTIFIPKTEKSEYYQIGNGLNLKDINDHFEEYFYALQKNLPEKVKMKLYSYDNHFTVSIDLKKSNLDRNELISLYHLIRYGYENYDDPKHKFLELFMSIYKQEKHSFLNVLSYVLRTTESTNCHGFDFTPGWRYYIDDFPLLEINKGINKKEYIFKDFTYNYKGTKSILDLKKEYVELFNKILNGKKNIRNWWFLRIRQLDGR